MTAAPSLQLLVSVRSVAEARAAWQAGADIVDLKEPTNGSLGRVDAAVLSEICADPQLADAPLSAAWGELEEGVGEVPDAVRSRLRFIKVGLAGQAQSPNWRRRLAEYTSGLEGPIAAGRRAFRMVPVAYADARRAQAPAIDAVVDYAIEFRPDYLLIDTWRKDGQRLWDFIDESRLAQIAGRLAGVGVGLALAGSLKRECLSRLCSVGAAIAGVRGAACLESQREQRIDAQRVAELKQVLRQGTMTPGPNF